MRVLQAGHDVEYPAFVRWMARELKWDLAVAPLCDDVFTRAKSDIKALDYAGLGVPAVYSNVGPYAVRCGTGRRGCSRLTTRRRGSGACGTCWRTRRCGGSWRRGRGSG